MKSFVFCRVSQWPNLRHLWEPLGGTEVWLETAEDHWWCDDDQTRMLEGSKF